MLCNAFPHIAGKMSSIRLPCKPLTLKIWLRLFGNHWQLCGSNGQMPHILFVRSLILSLPWLLTMVTSDCDTNLEFTGGIFISFLIWLNHLFHIGLDSSPQEEFLSLLGGARTSPPIHQFLANSLGEAVCSVFLGFSHERIQKILWLYISFVKFYYMTGCQACVKSSLWCWERTSAYRPQSSSGILISFSSIKMMLSENY